MAHPVSSEEVDYNQAIKPLLAQKCVSCHGEARPRGGLRLDTAVQATRGGKNGPAVIPGDSENSLLIMVLLEDTGPGRMPLKRDPLTPAEVDLLRAWIDQGAHSPENEPPTTLRETHWAFLPPVRSPLPDVSDNEWPTGAIDCFILARLAKEELNPSPGAERRTLIRRVTLDLTGLPPTPDEISSFLQDTRPTAYERLVDRLMASPRFGERWARPWLDAARYADSNGYSIDAPRSIWKYRDWVIDAINGDQPYDEFLTDQIAGDLRPSGSLSQKVATGFHRNTQINEEGGIDPEQFRVDAVADRVNTTSTVFMGLTLACAQCHDHKYDPLQQREYYQLFAFFNTADEPEIEFATPEELKERDEAQAALDAFLKSFKNDNPDSDSRLRNWEANLTPAFKVSQPSETKKTFDVEADKRTDRQNQLMLALYLETSPDYPEARATLLAHRQKLKSFVRSLVIQEQAQKRPTFVHIAGDFSRRGDEVTPGVPGVLPPLNSIADGTPDRLDLARWLTNPSHPLTARVYVNRIWQTYFGNGLVETENDFGSQGSPPTHPELLDWLATEIISQGWSSKNIQRQIVMSRTYRQSSATNSLKLRIDPSNRWLSRQNRLRLDAELIRDVSLASSGLLSERFGGPSVFPPQPEGVMTLGQVKRAWTVSQGTDRYRRGLYTHFWRASPHPALTVFDAPGGIQSCTRRLRSNTPVQALTLLNDEAFFEAAQALAARLLREKAPGDDESRIHHGFILCLGRPPSRNELHVLTELLATERAQGEEKVSEQAAWTTISRVLSNLDEFMTRE